MTRKDYIVLAAAIRRQQGRGDEQTRRELALGVAQVLRGDNGAFDYGRFMRAAEVPYPLPKPEPVGHGWRPRKSKVRAR